MTDNELKEHCLKEAGIDLGMYSYNELNVIKDALRRYHNAKLKLLNIYEVSGRSELLHVFDEDEEQLDEPEPCPACGNIDGMVNPCCGGYDPLHYKNCGYG